MCSRVCFVLHFFDEYMSDQILFDIFPNFSQNESMVIYHMCAFRSFFCLRFCFHKKYLIGLSLNHTKMSLFFVGPFRFELSNSNMYVQYTVHTSYDEMPLIDTHRSFLLIFHPIAIHLCELIRMPTYRHCN